MNKTNSKLSFKEKLGYGLGDTASHFVWDMVGFWIMIFYTDTFGLSAVAAGTIMAIARFWDMGIDPIVGVISDRTNTRWGKFRPYILFGAIPYAILAILTFTTPNFGEIGKILYAGATYVLLMTAYAFVNLPYSSLGAVMTNDSYERAGLNTYRFICSFIGQLLVSGFALTIASYLGGDNKALGYQRTLIFFAFLSLVFFFITFKTTKERVHPPKSQQNSVKEDIKSLFQNRAWIILAIVGIVSFVMFAIQNLSVAYYFKYYMGKELNINILGKVIQYDAERNTELFNIISSIALIAALPFSKPLAKRFGNKNVFIGSSILSGLFFILIYIPSPDHYWTVYTFNIFAKMSYAPAVPLLWTMIADSADYGEWKTGRRATGLYFSAAVFAQKAGWGIGAALVGLLLGLFNYVPNVAQSAESITGIKLLVSVIPGLMYMSCAIFMIFYNIDVGITDIMKKELEERREKE
ncbi:MAG: MFS transporter [Bacteroidales bacterium]|nr:MFS transporter [Bacteroidales bacterium]